MAKLRFTGRIYPTALHVSINNFPSVQWIDGWTIEAGLTPICHVAVQKNEVSIDVEVVHFDRELHFVPLAMRAYDTVRAAVDLLSFSSGNGFTFLFECWTDPDGITKPLAPQQQNLAPLASAVANSFDEIIKIVIVDPPLFLALRDLVESITQWHQAPIAAARSIERLRHSIAPNETDRKKQWRKLGGLLQLEESYTKIIRDTSIAPRHGDPSHIPGYVTNEIARRAWTIMNRYLEFRKRGGVQPLSASEFPPLT